MLTQTYNPPVAVEILPLLHVLFDEVQQSAHSTFLPIEVSVTVLSCQNTFSRVPHKISQR